MKKTPVNNDDNYPVWLHEVRFFDLIDHIAIDYMHEGMLGIDKLLLKLWFSTEFKMKNFNLRENIHYLTEYFLKIKL